MSPIRVALVLVVVLVVGACSDSGSPATTPPVTSLPPGTTIPTTATTAATVVTTTTLPPTTTTTTQATTTTVDRVAEVEEIIRDLELRRLDALFREDEEAFRTLFANEAYLEESLQLLGAVEFVSEPSAAQVDVQELLFDGADCLAARALFDSSAVLGPDAVATLVIVIERTATGEWGFSYGGTGWLCDGPHPLGS